MIAACAILLVAPSLAQDSPPKALVKEMRKLQEIGMALRSYAEDSDGEFPKALSDLLGIYFNLPSYKTLLFSDPKTQQAEDWLYFSGFKIDDDPKIILAASPIPAVEKNGKPARIVLYVDLSATIISQSEFEKTVKAQAARPPHRQTTPALTAYHSFHKPLAFRPPGSHVIFYVETDGRHVTALDSDGKILWCRNPFVEARLKPYRTPRPVIRLIGQSTKGTTDQMEEKFISVAFDSSQFGFMDIKTGDFTFSGQD